MVMSKFEKKLTSEVFGDLKQFSIFRMSIVKHVKEQACISFSLPVIIFITILQILLFYDFFYKNQIYTDL